MSLEPSVLPIEIGYLPFRFFAGNSIALLNSTNKLIALSLDNLPIIVGQLAPFLLSLPDELLPVSLHLVRVHFGTSIFSCSVETGRQQSEFPLATSAAVLQRESNRVQ